MQIVRARHYALSTIYRGQRDASWKLESMWDRRLDNTRQVGKELGGKDAKERLRDLDSYFGPSGRTNRNLFRDRSLSRFIESIKGLPGVGAERLERDWRFAWAIGRHHGLATPLLDWSHTPSLRHSSDAWITSTTVTRVSKKGCMPSFLVRNCLGAARIQVPSQSGKWQSPRRCSWTKSSKCSTRLVIIPTGSEHNGASSRCSTTRSILTSSPTSRTVDWLDI